MGTLIAAPTLVVATSDAALRFYTFGHMGQQEQSLIRPPHQLPAQLPWPQAPPPAAGGVTSHDLTAGAAKTALPDTDEVGVEPQHYTCPSLVTVYLLLMCCWRGVAVPVAGCTHSVVAVF
jgi:hypothetical protein